MARKMRNSRIVHKAVHRNFHSTFSLVTHLTRNYFNLGAETHKHLKNLFSRLASKWLDKKRKTSCISELHNIFEPILKIILNRKIFLDSI